MYVIGWCGFNEKYKRVTTPGLKFVWVMAEPFKFFKIHKFLTTFYWTINGYMVDLFLKPDPFNHQI